MKIRKFITRYFLIIAIVGIVGMGFPKDLYAGICTPPFDSIEEAFIRSDIVFTGVVVGYENVEVPSENGVSYINYEIFKIKEKYKSPDSYKNELIYVYRGLEKLPDTVGQEFVVYGQQISQNKFTKQNLSTVNSQCTRTGPSFSQELQWLKEEQDSADEQSTNETVALVGKIKRLSLQLEDFGSWDHIPTIKSDISLEIQNSFYSNDKKNVPNSIHNKLGNTLKIGNSLNVITFYCDREFKINEVHLLNVRLRTASSGSIEFLLECDGGKKIHKNKGEKKILQQLSR